MVLSQDIPEMEGGERIQGLSAFQSLQFGKRRDNQYLTLLRKLA